MHGPNTLVELGYDWRLSNKRMQQRDREFSRYEEREARGEP